VCLPAGVSFVLVLLWTELKEGSAESELLQLLTERLLSHPRAAHIACNRLTDANIRKACCRIIAAERRQPLPQQLMTALVVAPQLSTQPPALRCLLPLLALTASSHCALCLRNRREETFGTPFNLCSWRWPLAQAAVSAGSLPKDGGGAARWRESDRAERPLLR
jgi:hypothetical protein